MKLFLTSNPFLANGEICSENDFLWNFKYSLPYETNALFISSFYKDAITNDRFASKIKDSFNSAAIFFKTMDVLDFRSLTITKEEIMAHNLIIFADGNIATQNDFFKAIGLKSKLEGYDGTILGIGTGAMNLAQEAYCLPEEESDITNPDFVRFYEGLGLTKTQIIPDYEELTKKNLGGFSLRDRIVTDSNGKKFLGLPNGSYLMSTDGHELVYGSFYKIIDKNVSKEEAGFMPKSFD